MRPHEGADGKTPAELYCPSERRYRNAVPATYPSHFVVKRVCRERLPSFAGDKYFLSSASGSYDLGLEQLDELRWRVRFHQIDCGELEVLPS